MAIEFGRAETADEIHAVQRLRYDVYVEEMGRYRDLADHTNRVLVEPEDEYSWLFYARAGDELVAASRVTWGCARFSERQVEQYRIAPFLDELPADLMCVAERLMVVPAHRASNLVEQLIESGRPFMEPYGLHIVFSCCEPHLLPMYLARGQLPYADRNINSAEAGYLIPLVMFVPDVDALRGLGDAADDSALPRCVERVVAGESRVASHLLSSRDEYWSEIQQALDELHSQRISAFDGFTDDEAARCLGRTTIIECGAGDRLLKKGGVARNMFVVLDGTLEARDDDRMVGVLSPGDAFGEMAFLLERPRAFDVVAATDGVRVLSLSETALRKMIAEDAVVAAKLLLNLSKMLCVRLIKAN